MVTDKATRTEPQHTNNVENHKTLTDCFYWLISACRALGLADNRELTEHDELSGESGEGPGEGVSLDAYERVS